MYLSVLINIFFMSYWFQSIKHLLPNDVQYHYHIS